MNPEIRSFIPENNSYCNL